MKYPFLLAFLFCGCASFYKNERMPAADIQSYNQGTIQKFSGFESKSIFLDSLNSYLAIPKLNYDFETTVGAPSSADLQKGYYPILPNCTKPFSKMTSVEVYFRPTNIAKFLDFP